MEAGCTATLIPSGGVLNIPNFGQFHLRARTVAMALVHVPDNPFWGEFAVSGDKSPASAALATHTAFNFGAPGGRTDDKGLQWTPVTARSNGFVVKGDKLDWFKLHPHLLVTSGGRLHLIKEFGCNFSRIHFYLLLTM